MRKTISAGLVCLFATIVFILLGFWQLSRLDQRRAYNAQVNARFNAPPLVLTGSETGDPANLQYRTAIARGTYDYAHEQAKVNQFWEGNLGVQLLTPLVITGSNVAVIVDRGWIPVVDSAPDHWAKYAVPQPVEVTGWMQLSEANGTTAKFPTDPRTWFRIDTVQMQSDAGHPVLPFWIQPIPAETQETPPYDTPFAPDLSEGPHMGYAIEWFAFAGIAVIGYVALVASGRLSDKPKTPKDKPA